MSSFSLADGRTVNWASEMAAHLLTLQNAEGGFTNAEPRWMEGNAVICTAYALEALRLCQAAINKK